MFDDQVPSQVGASLSLDDENPPAIEGNWSPFFFSFHPWSDLIVSKDGRLLVTPAKDFIKQGLQGVYLAKDGLHWQGLADRIRETFGRIVLTDRKAYSKVYRKADPAARTPEQVIEKWITIRWVAGRPIVDCDQKAMDAFFEAVAWSINPSKEQIAEAERRSGNKLTKRPKEA